MSAIFGKMGASSGVIKGISPDVLYELQQIAKENQFKGNEWNKVELAILDEYGGKVTRNGIVKMLEKVSPDKQWTAESVRSKYRRVLEQRSRCPRD